jgi:hypothetical protein
VSFLGNILAAKLVAKVTERLDRAQTAPPVTGEYIPASQAQSFEGHGNALLDRVARLYERNPRLVATVGTALVAILVAALSRRRRF